MCTVNLRQEWFRYSALMHIPRIACDEVSVAWLGVYTVKPDPQYGHHTYEISEYEQQAFLESRKKTEIHCQTQLSTLSGVFTKA